MEGNRFQHDALDLLLATLRLFGGVRQAGLDPLAYRRSGHSLAVRDDGNLLGKHLGRLAISRLLARLGGCRAASGQGCCHDDLSESDAGQGFHASDPLKGGRRCALI